MSLNNSGRFDLTDDVVFGDRGILLSLTCLEMGTTNRLRLYLQALRPVQALSCKLLSKTFKEVS